MRRICKYLLVAILCESELTPSGIYQSPIGLCSVNMHFVNCIYAMYIVKMCQAHGSGG